ncbi:MAG: hypothetical protein H6765_00600 [Candidatus Peribacteria bacterium]|nr:MAG: hypothetical protein H6765_00600 [Candidatus Peribacteria bacterium]
MSEKALANKMRITILDHVSQKDLPGFMFEQIDNHLAELNYYKISNLLNNMDRYDEYLEGVEKNYREYILAHNPREATNTLSSTSYEPFMTNSFYGTDYTLNFSPRELIKISSLFGVSCLLTMKEYVNRRILQRSPNKALVKQK